MTAPARVFPDIVAAVVELLKPFVPAPERVGTHTPPDLEQQLPFIRVLRVGGGDDGIADAATVDVDVFTGTYNASWLLAEQVRQFLTSRWHRTTTGVVLDQAVTETGPRELPWGDEQTLRRQSATYTVTARRTPTP